MITLIILILLSLYLWHNICKTKNGEGPWKNQLQKRLINKKRFRVHLGGAYAWLSIAIGKPGYHEFELLFGCTDRPINYMWRTPDH